MNPCCIVLPYYRETFLLEWQLHLWNSYSKEVRSALTFIIVDDGSPDNKAVDTLIKNKELIKEAELKINLYEIFIDKKWNSEGASNLGIKEVTTDRFVRIDFDYHFPNESMEKILSIDLKSNEWYLFTAQEYGTNRELVRHVNTYLMMKDSFWKSGGYDEDFCGNYGWTDVLLDQIFSSYAKRYTRDDIIMLTCPKLSAHGLDRNRETNYNLLLRKREEMQNKTYNPAPAIRFPWRKVEW